MQSVPFDIVLPLGCFSFSFSSSGISSIGFSVGSTTIGSRISGIFSGSSISFNFSESASLVSRGASWEGSSGHELFRLSKNILLNPEVLETVDLNDRSL